ncbi:outer membrane protein [Bradyrhizobium sp. 6(2017)]|jgi:outer membrane immunogenic protein|uniref:outer membrane protein n=1 Tax=unclassified Bradyrhizobium TaxID=2631580 RepID=UPI0013E1D995|nr:outer membrane protein [Bradyrhizobium sp. 6(2017)]QIG91475.1 porin family protein [Bradyrhizobium sp. 6(2017)]
MNDMKKFIIGAAFAAVSSTSAFAADLPVQAYKSAPVVAQVYNWTGLYVGVNGGYGWGSQDPLTLVSNRFDRTSFNISGGMLGGTMGAQIQQGYVVIGLEGDLDWANIKGNGISNPAIAGIGQGIALDIASKVSAIGTARARVGVALNNSLLYVTGGAAFVKSSANGTSIAGLPCGTLGVLPNCAASAWRPGIVAGLGIEYGFTPNWSLKGEYLFTQVVGTGASTDKLNTFRGGINYRF